MNIEYIFAVQVVEKQKRKTEEEKQIANDLKHDNRSLSDTCQEVEIKRQKLEHELQSKEAFIACLEGQLAQTKKVSMQL